MPLNNFGIEIFHREWEGVTYSNMERSLPLFSKLNMNIIYSHLGIYTLTTLPIRPLTVTEQVDRDKAFFQPNSAYIYCSMETPPEILEKSPFYTLLATTNAKVEARNQIVGIPLSFDKEIDKFDFPLPVKKSLKFIDERTGKEIGWYNIFANILWLSDIAHIPDRFSETINGIVTHVVNFRTYGTLPAQRLIMGADPEFEILNNTGKLVPAHQLLPTDMSAPVGVDGDSNIGELRPEPSRNPLGLFRNTKRLVGKLGKGNIGKAYKICAGGGKVHNVGGHIHFDIHRIPSQLMDALFTFVGDAIIPHQTGVRNDCTSITTRTGKGATRTNSHGFEWRSLPSWLVSERVAKSTLCTVYAIARAFQLGKLPEITNPVGNRYQILRDLPLYKVYKDEIEDFMSLFYDGEVGIMEGKEIRDRWNIPRPTNEPSVFIYSNNPKVKEYFKPIVANLNKPVVLMVNFEGDRLVTWGLPQSVRDLLSVFAHKYFALANHRSEDIGQIEVRFPIMWGQYLDTGGNEVLLGLREVIKQVCIILGNGE